MNTTADRLLSSPQPPIDDEPNKLIDLGLFGKAHIPAFKALISCMGDSDRYNLNAIQCETTNGLAYLSATNGHVMLTVEVVWPEATAPVRTSITAESAKDFVASKGFAPLDRHDCPETFPDIRNVIPASFAEPHSRLGLNANYISLLAKVLKVLGHVGKNKQRPVTMQHNGPLSPMLFSVDSCSGAADPIVAASMVIMPIRLD